MERLMGIFGDRPECRPPDEFDSWECYRRWAESEASRLRKSTRPKIALQASAYRNLSAAAEAKGEMDVQKSMAKIEESKNKLRELLSALAKKTTGAAGIAKGEFEKDTPIKTTPKSRKIKKIISPSVQIAGLETKAVASGLPSRFYKTKEERPI